MTISIANLTSEHFCTSIKWIAMMSDSKRWNLSDEQVARLIAIDSVAIYKEILEKAEADALEKLPSETIERLSLLLGMWKCLQFLAPHQRIDLAFCWFSKANNHEMFQNKSIKDYLLNGNSMNDFYKVKRHLESILQIPD